MNGVFQVVPDIDDPKEEKTEMKLNVIEDPVSEKTDDFSHQVTLKVRKIGDECSQSSQFAKHEQN